MVIRNRLITVLVAQLLLMGPVPVMAAPESDLWPYWDASNAASESRIEHGVWQEFLDTYLRPAPDGIHRVAYLNVSSVHRASLQRYLQRLADTDPRQLNRSEQFAYWVNLYNALTVHVVLGHPGKDSIRRMGRRLLAGGPWDDPLITIAGQPVTLNDIEHRILRPIWQDHRIHYAVNCASLGCPNLVRQAYTADNAEQLLQASERAYVNHPRGVRFDDRGRLIASQIYRWYREDFAADQQGLLAYLARHHATLGDRLRGYAGRVRYDYDWSLNAAD